MALLTLAFAQLHWIPAQGRNDDTVFGMTITYSAVINSIKWDY